MKPKIVIILGAMAIAATVSLLVSSSIVEAYAQGCPCHKGSGATWVCHMDFPCKRVGPHTIQCKALATTY
jgi:hypothetical protein